MDIKRRIDFVAEENPRRYADECAARLEKSLETKWDPSTGPPKPFELPEKPSLLENGSMAIRYWNLIVDVSEKLAAFDEQTAETLDTFREALKRYGVEATPPRDLGPTTGPANAGLGGGTGKEPSGARVDGTENAIAGKKSADGEPGKTSVSTVESEGAPAVA
jgi:hypothetical protein